MPTTFPNLWSLAKKGFGRPRLVLLDCLRGEKVILDRFPCRLGHGESMAWTAPSLAPGAAGCLIEAIGGTFRLTPESPDAVRVNGETPSDACTVPATGLTLLQIGRDLAALAGGDAAEAQVERALADDWRIFRLRDGQTETVTRFRDLPEIVRQRGLNPDELAAAPLGLDHGFPLTQVLEAIGVAAPGAPAAAEALLDGSSGDFTCPICWQKFDAGDAMNIAAHDSLRGDPILGEDARLRFYPTRFNDLGQAIDPMGLPSSDLACPHCRRKLPPGFLEIPQHIFSIVGAPSAGKSYYLAILLKMLQQTLFREFGVVLKDGDPTGNMLLNQMKNQLFSAALPEEAVLAKTALEGTMYERLPRLGKLVALPRPFIYALGRAPYHLDGTVGSAVEQSTAEPAIECSMIFYDNAGEHFEPGVDLDDSPGALHVASSACIFFLFDPTSNHGFRQRLSGSTDPQLAQHGRLDQQDSIMAEMELRVKRLLAYEAARKIETPVAILIGKCDVWKHLVDWDKFGSPVRDGRVDHRIVDENSALLREFLIQMDATIVAHAEGLARQVRYFAVSAFGHSPTRLTSGPAAGLLAPDPARLAPLQLEIPTLWALSRLVPNLVPPV
jgi:hypothetical protein